MLHGVFPACTVIGGQHYAKRINKIHEPTLPHSLYGLPRITADWAAMSQLGLGRVKTWTLAVRRTSRATARHETQIMPRVLAAWRAMVTR
jgi:hypothetical protein